MTPGQTFTASLIGHLKGAPLSCLMLLIISGQPQPAEYLQRYSRYSDKVVAQALLFLQDEGLITRNGRYSWQLSKYAAQLPLITTPDDFAGVAQTGLESAAGGVEACDPSPIALTGASPVAGEMGLESKRESENLRLGISDSSSSSRSLIKDSRDLNINPLLARGPDSEILRLLLAALDEWGVREPARSTIAQMPGMTLARIDYHCEKCEHLGQAIYRIKNDWPYQETSEYAKPVITQESS